MSVYVAEDMRVCDCCHDVFPADEIYFGEHPTAPQEMVYLCVLCLGELRCSLIDS